MNCKNCGREIDFTNWNLNNGFWGCPCSIPTKKTIELKTPKVIKEQIEEMQEKRRGNPHNLALVNLIEFNFSKEIKPIRLMREMDQSDSLQIARFYLYSYMGSEMYKCVDTIKGESFYLQVFDNKMNVNLSPDCTGDFLDRIISFLQEHLQIECEIQII